MRVIQTYTFKLSSKLPYSDYPTIARRFLDEQNLVSHHFFYYFEETRRGDSYEKTLATGSCAKAIKDLPILGTIRFLNGSDFGLIPVFFLSNIDIDTGCTEADILSIMKKIHRRYGFFGSDLYYYDIDFFHNIIPYERDMSFAEYRSMKYQHELEPTLGLDEQLYGSCIRLHRDITGGNYISLSIDLLHNGKVQNAAPYFDSMKKLLPNIRPRVTMQIYLTDEEKSEIALWDKQILPVLEKTRSFFAERFPTQERRIHFFPSYTIASKLKKLAKDYGFSYHYVNYGTCILDKRTPRGHVLRLFVDSGPSHKNTTYGVSIQGIGFCHWLGTSIQTPTNQEEVDACSEKMLSVVSEFEKTFIPELDAFYEETPDWFVPSAF